MLKRIACLVFLLCCIAGNVSAQTQRSVSLTCDPSPTPGVLYTLYRNGIPIQQFLTECKALDATVQNGTTYTYTVRATLDGKESIDSNIATAVIPALPPQTLPLIITTTTLPAGLVNVSYLPIQFGITGGRPPYTCQGSGSVLSPDPSWSLFINTNCSYSGVPTQAGSFMVNLTVTDSAGMVAIKPFPLTITAPSPPPPVITITITPTNLSMLANTMQQFTANVSGASNTGVVWSASVGAVSATGLYTAPPAAGSYTVMAQSAADTTKTATAMVTVTVPPPPPPPISISIFPTSVDMSAGATLQFSATVSATTTTGVTWSATGGVVSPTGLYTAPAAVGGYIVTVKSVADITKTANAAVTVSAPTPPPIVSTKFTIGDTAKIATSGGKLNVRSCTNLAGNALRTVDNNTIWAILGGPLYSGATPFWRISLGCVSEGFIRQ